MQYEFNRSDYHELVDSITGSIITVDNKGRVNLCFSESLKISLRKTPKHIIVRKTKHNTLNGGYDLVVLITKTLAYYAPTKKLLALAELAPITIYNMYLDKLQQGLTVDVIQELLRLRRES